MIAGVFLRADVPAAAHGAATVLLAGIALGDEYESLVVATLIDNLVRGLAAGLGLDPALVSSPTFALIHEYRGGRLPLFHADLYRLDRANAEDLGLDELAADGGILAIEWPDRLAWAPPGSAAGPAPPPRTCLARPCRNALCRAAAAPRPSRPA